MSSPSDVTQLLLAYSEGDRTALDRLLPLIYEQLRRLAHARLRDERPGHTLNTTALVHEAYLKLVDLPEVHYENRRHFFATASKVMRHVLVSYARRRTAQKRGGGAPHVSLHEDRLVMTDAYAETLLALDEGLQALEARYPREGQVVELCYFVGLTHREVAEALGVSLSTVERWLRFARAWMRRQWGAAPAA
jgi:RNA polymerase sigma factor (TIGR02999 family)